MADLEKMLLEAAGRKILPARKRHSSPPRKSMRKGSYSGDGCDSKSDDSDGDRVYESDNDSVRSDLYQDEDDREKLSKFERDLILAAGATKRSDRDLTEKLKRSDRDKEVDLEKMLREAARRTALPARNRHSSPPRKSRRKGSYSDDGSDSKSDDSDGDRVYESDNDSVRSDLYQDEDDREKLSKFERDLILAAGATKRSDRDLTEKLKRSDRDQEADLEKMLREAAGRTALPARNRHSSPPRKSKRKGSYSDGGSDSKNDDSDGDRVYDSDNDSVGSDLTLETYRASSRTDSRNPCNKEK